MRHNIGKVERVLRVVLGVALFFVGWVVIYGFEAFIVTPVATIVVGSVFVIAGLGLFITGLTSYCPLYSVLHINTCQACRLGETHRHMPV